MNQTNLKVIENGLIPIYEDNSKQVADARELHEFLEVNSKFADWIKNRIQKYDFIEGEDFTTLSKNLENGGREIQYILSLDTAKEIAMVENNERGRQIRKYFIEVEKRARQPKQMTQSELIASMALQNVELERNVTALKNQFDKALDVFTAPSKDDWRHDMTDKINQIVVSNGLNHQGFRHELYAELERTARVDLASRQVRLRERMKTAGYTTKDREAISKLDIVERDPKLQSIFESIVRKYQAKYGKVASYGH